LRYSGNPIVTNDAVPGCNSIFNSEVVPFQDGVDPDSVPTDSSARNAIEGKANASADCINAPVQQVLITSDEKFMPLQWH